MRHRWASRGVVAVAAATALLAISPGSAAAVDSGPRDLGGLGDAVRSVTQGLQQKSQGSSEGAQEETTTTEQNRTQVPKPEIPKPEIPEPKVPEPEIPEPEIQKPQTQEKSSVPAPEPSSDDDSDGHETDDPQPPDHAGGSAADVDLAEKDVADAGDSGSTVNDDNSTDANASPLAVAGEEILGADASSEGNNEDHAGDPLAALCEGTHGALCLRILFADAYASESDSTSSSSGQSGVLGACLAGSSADPQAECDGAVGAGVGTSDTEAERNKESGQTTASSEGSIADLCVQQPGAAECAIDLSALQSEGQADSGNSPGTADRSSNVLAAALGGQDLFRIDDPFSVTVPDGCPADFGLVCLFLNQGESYVGDGVAGHAQEALHAEALRGTPLTLVGEVGRSETLVHNAAATDDPDSDGPDGDGPDGDGPEVSPDEDAGDRDDSGDQDDSDVAGAGAGSDGDGGAAAGDAGWLPNTGGLWSGLLAVALFALAAGAFFIAYSRRSVRSLT